MLKKFITVRNVGRFLKCTASGDVELQRLNLIFGGNGQGKTTLCAIVRSLQGGDSRYLSERTTRGQTDAPSVVIRTDAGNASFDSGGWSQTMPAIEVYDSEFIHENVYAGEFVDHDHKKQLYRVMIGERGVILARKVDDLDEQSRNFAREIRQKKQIVDAFIPEGVAFKEFIDLEKQEGIDEALTAKTAEVDALERASEIKGKAKLQKIILPTLPENFAAILARELEDVAAGVEQQVQDHINGHTRDATVSWLAQGRQFQSADDCPFCGQSVKDVELVQAYSVLFGEQYRDLKAQISGLATEIDARLGEAAILKADKTNPNGNIAEFWRQFVTVELPEFVFSEVVKTPFEKLHTLAAELVTRKSMAPLEPVALGAEFAVLQTESQSARDSVNAYNAAVDVVNALIDKRKVDAEAGNLAEERRTLQRLNATKVRHEADATAACLEYQKSECSKKKCEADKEQAKIDLRDHSKRVFGAYKRRINELLESFAADFQIGEITPSYAGGHPSSSFPVVINDDQVDLGDAKTPRGTPSFRSALSAGDRSSLALAFFIARLENLATLADTVIVFDDPFTSQDRSRRTHTQQLICRIANQAKQVLVTSHDPHFLKLIWDKAPAAGVKTLQLARVGNNCTITEWDIEEETRNSYIREIAQLRTFLGDGTGDLRDVARKIRPLLEGHLRLRFPHQFQDDEWLGDFIKKICDAAAGSPLAQLQGDPLTEVMDINDFSKKYHHKQNPGGADTEPIDHGELSAYVLRTLRFVGSC